MKKFIFYIFALFSLAFTPELTCYSPTEVFLESHSINSINYVLNEYGMNQADKELFISAIKNENEGFIGYHAGSNNYMLFQDIIAMVLKEKLDIPIREDFYFLRVPGTSVLTYPSAKSFIDKFIKNYSKFNDNQPETRIHILSLNTSLYQSYEQPWDLTPRYYLENKPWTTPAFWTYLQDFFKEAGLDSNCVTKIVQQASLVQPQNRGLLMQFFDSSLDHSFLNTHFYVAHSGGKPYQDWTPSEFLLYPLINKQLRLVIDNKHILNPFGQLNIRRYDSMTAEQRKNYKNTLQRAVKNLPINEIQKDRFHKKLMDMWSPTS